MIELKSMAVAMPEVEGHPNRAAFSGSIDGGRCAFAAGAVGVERTRVVLTKAAAEAALPSLLGMALDYSPSLDRHDVRRKVGVITRAEIVGRNLRWAGICMRGIFRRLWRRLGNGSAAGASGPIRAFEHGS